MKRIVFILLVVLGLLIAGCGKKTTAPVFTDENWMQKGEYTLYTLAYRYADTFRQVFFLYSKGLVDEITINGIPYPMEYNEYAELEGYYWNFIDVSDLEHPPIVASDQNCDYSFVMNGKTYSGSVLIPSELDASFPRFDYDTNYNISWSSRLKPNNYLVTYEFEDFYSDEEIYEDTVQLAGSATSYSISKKGWQHLNKLRIEYWIALYALNYTRQEGGSLAVAAVMQDYSNWKQADAPATLQDWQQLFRQILSGEINLD